MEDPARPPRAQTVVKRGVNWNLLVPVGWALALPMARLGLRRSAVPAAQQNNVFAGIVAGSMAHAAYVIFSDSTVL